MVTKKNSTPATMQAMPEAEQRNTESAPVTAPATPEPAYRPGTLKPTTDKEWAYANFRQPKQFLGDMLFHSQSIALLVMKTDAGNPPQPPPEPDLEPETATASSA
jgi:hypothetical protein